MAYHRFCRENSRYHHTMSNQLHMIRWVDDRRIEMLAEARPHWGSLDERLRARDVGFWDDLVQR